jgi:hypothetical protein
MFSNQLLSFQFCRLDGWLRGILRIKYRYIYAVITYRYPLAHVKKETEMTAPGYLQTYAGLTAGCCLAYQYR